MAEIGRKKSGPKMGFSTDSLYKEQFYMNSIHDHSIYYIEIQCGIGEIIFHTHLVNAEEPEEKEVRFIGVIGHNFMNVLEGNIIFDITKEKPDQFFNNHESDLQEYQKFGLRLNCSNTEYFLNSLNLNGVSIFCINSSYGMSGWIIAKEMKITEK